MTREGGSRKVVPPRWYFRSANKDSHFGVLYLVFGQQLFFIILGTHCLKCELSRDESEENEASASVEEENSGASVKYCSPLLPRFVLIKPLIPRFVLIKPLLQVIRGQFDASVTIPTMTIMMIMKHDDASQLSSVLSSSPSMSSSSSSSSSLSWCPPVEEVFTPGRPKPPPTCASLPATHHLINYHHYH